MFTKNLLTVSITILFMALSGCASRIPLNYDQTRLYSLVKIKTNNGNIHEGIVRAKRKSLLVLQTDKDNDRALAKIDRNEIVSIQGQKHYPTDEVNMIISEWEIEKQQTNKKFLLYTLGGGGLSFGVSFFIGSLLNRGIDDVDQGRQAMWATTAAGTALGTFLFSRGGAKKDRAIAINEIREQRFELAKKQAEEERIKRKQIQQELEKEKKKRERQEQEIKELMEKAKKKEKEKEKP